MGHWLRPEAPEATPAKWHVSPAIDLAAYAFSWAWILIPIAFLGPARADYLIWYLVAVVLTDVHRMFGLPYVFMDASVRSRYPYRFFGFSAALLAAFIASPLLIREKATLTPLELSAWILAAALLLQLMRRDGGDHAPSRCELVSCVLRPQLIAAASALLLVFGPTIAIDPAWPWIIASLYGSGQLDAKLVRRLGHAGRRPAFVTSVAMLLVVAAALFFGESLMAQSPKGEGIPFRLVYALIATFAILWNFWHVYMQKYGILRMYNAKAGGGVPGWVDRALVFAWLPLFFSWLGPVYRDLAKRYFARSRGMLEPLLDVLEAHEGWLVPLCIAFLVAAVSIWLVYEFRGHRFRHAPRLWMAAGTMAINAAFSFVDPVKVYLAFAFSHAIEYMVFVWAFQRRRYARPLAHRPTLGRVLRHPALAYFGFIFAVGVVYLFASYYGRYFFEMPRSERPQVLGVRAAVWMSYWGIYQSLQHFYFDGFLWKMRHASVRENL